MKTLGQLLLTFTFLVSLPVRSAPFDLYFSYESASYHSEITTELKNPEIRYIAFSV